MTSEVRAPSLVASRPMWSLARLLAPSAGRLLVAVLAYLVKDSPQWLLPLLTASVVDAVVRGAPVLDLVWLGAAACAIIALNLPTNILWVRLSSATVRDLGVTLRQQLAHRLQELSIGFHTRTSASIIQTKVVRDVENVELMLLQGSGPALSALGVLGGAGIVLGVQAPAFLLLFVLVLPVSACLIHWMRRRSTVRNEAFRRDVELFSSRVGEMASLLPITRAHGVEPVATERVVTSARTVRDSGFMLDVVNGTFGALAWVVFQLLTIACLIGAAVVALVGPFAVSPGQVVLLSTYFAVMTGSVVQLMNLAPIVTRGRESIRSMAEVLDEPDLERNAGKRAVERVVGALRFEGVDLRYPGSDAPAIVDLHLAVRPGETVALVGHSGSGKSTILNLALGFLRPTGGRILLDGVDMEELDLRTVRRHVSVVPQESVLSSGTIRDTVTYGLGHVPDERVLAALRDANALDVVESLPHGLDTVLGERGAGLSGGQRQRMSIARALIRDPRILLLDEATSALDGESERLVQEALQTLRRGRTTLVVAHRLATVRTADRILVLDRGRVVEEGTHEALLRASGPYARLFASQAG